MQFYACPSYMAAHEVENFGQIVFRKRRRFLVAMATCCGQMKRKSTRIQREEPNSTLPPSRQDQNTLFLLQLFAHTPSSSRDIASSPAARPTFHSVKCTRNKHFLPHLYRALCNSYTVVTLTLFEFSSNKYGFSFLFLHHQ